MKTSGGKEILLLVLVLIQRGPQKRQNPVRLQMGFRMRRMGPNEIEPVGKQKYIIWKNKTIFITYVLNAFSVQSLKGNFFSHAKLTRPLLASLPLKLS